MYQEGDQELEMRGFYFFLREKNVKMTFDRLSYVLSCYKDREMPCRLVALKSPNSA